MKQALNGDLKTFWGKENTTNWR